MATATLTLTDFLLARISEDEAAARAASAGPWRAEIDSDGPVILRATPHPASVGLNAVGVDLSSYYVAQTSYDDLSNTTFNSVADAEHIARHDPARVLAECEAKRRIVELHHTIDVFAWHPNGDCAECSDSGWEGAADGAQPVDAPCPTLRLLALPYSDHPDYRDEWKP